MSAAKKANAAAAQAKLPASVTMDAPRVLQAEALPEELATPGERSGVLYRLVVRDGAGDPVTDGKLHIRKHHVAVSSEGGLDPADGLARIVTVPLDGEGTAHDFVGLHAGSAADGEDVTFQYFSFELQGVTHAIERSGYALKRKKRGAKLAVTRTPHEGKPIHGEVAKGLVSEKADATFACKLGPAERTRPRATR